MEFDLAPFELYDIQRFGVGVYLWPLGLEGSAVSLTKTYSLFAGPNVASASIEFFQQRSGFSLQPRPFNFLNLSADHFHSGDMLSILRLDGIGPLIAYGTGGTTGHTAIFVQFPDGPYICESTDLPSSKHPD